jgi:hypothetical protein
MTNKASHPGFNEKQYEGCAIEGDDNSTSSSSIKTFYM